MSSLLLLLEIVKQRKSVLKTYGPGTYSFTIPAGVPSLKSLQGKGGTGAPGGQTWKEAYEITTTSYHHFDADNSTIITGEVKEAFAGPIPAGDHCDAQATITADGYDYKCYTYRDLSFWQQNPATKGPDTTAFGKTFPGGTGGAASSAQYSDWPVNAGQTYTLTVAANGSLSFTYYQ